MYEDFALTFTTVKFWATEFKRGCTSLGDDERLGHPKIKFTDDNIAHFYNLILFS